MFQVISNTLCNDKDNVSLLKCTDDLQIYYESIGFQKVQDGLEWLQIPNLKNHYNEINATKHMLCHILHLNTIINHKKKTFINHVKQSLINIDFNQNLIQVLC